MEHQHSLLKQHRECVALVFKQYGIDAPLTDQSLYLATRKLGKPFVNSLKTTIGNCSHFEGLPENTGTLTRGTGFSSSLNKSTGATSTGFGSGTLTPNKDFKLVRGTYNANSKDYAPRLTNSDGTVEYGEVYPNVTISSNKKSDSKKKNNKMIYVILGLIFILLIFIILSNGKKTLK